MKESLIGQAVAPSVSPLTLVAERPALDLSGARSRKLSEQLIGAFLFCCGALSIFTTIGIVVILAYDAAKFFGDVSPWAFYTGTTWTALFDDGQFGVLPIVSGTLQISGIAMIVALPLGLMSAIYLSEYASVRARSILKPTLELLAGVPTIVYGFFALTFITPHLLQSVSSEIQVFNALSAGIAVGIMILPMVASLSEDAMNAVPGALREGAYALGGTKLEVSTRIVVPAALSGIFASFILAISRAVGETMIVVIAAGARPSLGLNPFGQIQAMTSYIVAVISGDASTGGRIYYSLFAVGFTLFLMTLLLNIVSQWFVARYREVYQ